MLISESIVILDAIKCAHDRLIPAHQYSLQLWGALIREAGGIYQSRGDNKIKFVFVKSAPGFESQQLWRTCHCK